MDAILDELCLIVSVPSTGLLYRRDEWKFRFRIENCAIHLFIRTPAQATM